MAYTKNQVGEAIAKALTSWNPDERFISPSLKRDIRDSLADHFAKAIFGEDWEAGERFYNLASSPYIAERVEE